MALHAHDIGESAPLLVVAEFAIGLIALIKEEINMALENMAAAFSGLPMGDLIGGPLNASCDAQVRLAMATADFIKVVGLEEPQSTSGQQGKLDPWSGKTRTVKFRFTRPVQLV
ncbi:MAG: DUF2589 domain-containing protein, partial [Nitrospira sp.]|nr:DUF2589 domain-containing protein [Nitrospira sp.]